LRGNFKSLSSNIFGKVLYLLNHAKTHVVMSFYAKGMSMRNIRSQMLEIYELELSDSTVSNITERILVDVQQWQSNIIGSIEVLGNGLIQNETA
jgi:hypothetical protein